ncbi:hypothetical protein SDC9_32068 [bioreactor metagenome]|uniref:Uncharacterized protein n=1 Tax=bioreactor metagenome TaxID=1076179 RepID=A0A644V5K1_9ZZZZ
MAPRGRAGSEALPCRQGGLFCDRAKREHREERQRAQDRDGQDQQRHEQRPVRRESARGDGGALLRGERAGNRQHRHDDGIAAEEHQKAKGRRLPLRRRAEPAEGRAVVADG